MENLENQMEHLHIVMCKSSSESEWNLVEWLTATMAMVRQLSDENKELKKEQAKQFEQMAIMAEHLVKKPDLDLDYFRK